MKKKDETVHLFIDESRDSRDAKKMLQANHIQFESLPSTGASLPVATYRKAVYRGVTGIEQLVANVKEGKKGPIKST